MSQLIPKSDYHECPEAPVLPLAHLSIALFGTVLFALLAFDPFGLRTHNLFGSEIYNYLYQAIWQGRMDLPAIVLRYEGHYADDGTGYPYHGVAPLLTRFMFGWLIPLKGETMAAFSVWFWATIGTLLYHLAFLKVAQRNFVELSGVMVLVLSIGLWLVSPGLLLAANYSLYTEPLAVSYAATAGFIYGFLARDSRTYFNIKNYSVLAFWAVLAVHARPNVAVGLYAVLVFYSLYHFWHCGFRIWLRPAVAMVILFIGGLGYLGINKVKFGDPVQTHGTFTNEGVQYGALFFEREDMYSERNIGFREHGRFNLWRVGPNLAYYMLEAPPHVLPGIYNEKLLEWHEIISRKTAGVGRKASGIGLVFLWGSWILFIFLAIFYQKFTTKGHRLILLGTGIIAIFILSYMTITFRYRFELWPLLFILSASSLKVLASSTLSRLWQFLLVFSFSICIIGAFITSFKLKNSFAEKEGFFDRWTVEECETIVRKKGFTDADLKRLCTYPQRQE